MITLSFIIPTFNEEQNIGDTIDKIVHNSGALWPSEIIVVDNGSKDNTIKIARGRSAKTFNYPNIPVAALRNKGASESSGDILVFIDGDVVVTSQWGRELNEVINQLRKDPMQITGSVCGITKQPGWLEKNWFNPALRKKPPTYINSGHLIVSRELFTLIHGFDEKLETGEDVDFCERARMSGGTIVPNQRLAVIHKGYPRTLRAFIRRERWHGKGDYSSYQKFVSSKPAIASVLSTSVLVIALSSSIVTRNITPLAIGFVLFLMFCLMASIHRFGILRTETMRGVLVYGIYFIARALSLVDVLLQKITNKPKQQKTKAKLRDQQQ